MESEYKRLGFKQPAFLENPYGIRIYLGTIGKDDWCVVIPKELAKMKSSHYNYDKDYAIYFITEKEALATASIYTELAQKELGGKV